MRLPNRWLAFFLLNALLAGVLPAAVTAQSRDEFKYWLGKADVLQLKDGRLLAGKIVTVKKDGVVFDPRKVSFLYNPPSKFYPFSDVRKLVQKDGRIVYQEVTSSEKVRFMYTVNLLGSRYKAEHSTFWPIVLQVNAFSKRGEITATFSKSFNLDEGVGCCECWEAETPPYHYHVRYSTYFWQIGAKIPLKNAGFKFGFVGGRQERGWCDDGVPLLIPALPYAGAWGQITRHFSIGIKFLTIPYGVFTAGATWQSNNQLSSVWAGVVYFGDRIPRWSELQPSFRLQIRVRKSWLLHLRLYQVNQPYSSETLKLFLLGIGRVFNAE